MLAELALACLALCTPVEEKELTLPDTAVTVRAATVWPAQVHKGWIPCLITVVNAGERACKVDVHATAWGVEREVDASISVPAGAEGSIEMLLPAFPNTQNQFSLRLRHEGRSHWLAGNFGGSELGQVDARSILYFSEGEPEAGVTERWSGELSTAEVNGAGRAIRHTGSLTGYVSFGTPPPTPPTGTPNNVQVHHVRFDRLPQHAESFTSGDVVVLDTSNGLPSERSLAPLYQWLRLGGTVALLGPRATELARASSELAPWLEPRFALASESVALARRAGLGTLLVDDAPPLSTPEQRNALQHAALDGNGMVHDDGGSRMRTSLPVVPDLFALPYKLFALLLVLFAIVIGPVNFVLVKRSKRPVLLLVTIPVIALGAALALFGFGIVSQGLGVKVASHTFALLDQREHRSMASEMRMLFAGLAPARGLEPGPGAALMQVARYTSGGGWTEPAYDGQRYLVAHDPGLVLAGGYLPARAAFLHQIVTERAERGRLELAHAGGELAATNALGTTVERLLVRDEAGRYWTSAAPLGESARTTLAPLDDAQAEELANELGLATLLPKIGALPAACYLARLERGVFGDDCGVAGTESVSFHHVLGVLAADGEEWR
ncbi:MAG: hypothetical protein HZA52_08250 [Planctomycetes bacterium]|nr:hypothetical protein [Planctomycetota bacterium]